MPKIGIVIGYPLGDCIAAMPYFNKFINDFDHDVIIKLGNPYHQTLFKKSFPNIQYTSGIPDCETVINIIHKFDKPLQAGIAEQLGYTNAPYIRPIVDSFKTERPIKGKYVVISCHSTSQLKYWNHPTGKKSQRETLYWNELCQKFRKVGLTPVVIDRDELFGESPYFNGVPNKAQKKLGLSLPEVANYIEHAEFFIGLSSGLTWLAHALGQKVAMIANFTEDWYEFDMSCDDYIRISNPNVCHGCWNKVNLDFAFDTDDWYWCPLHKNTSQQFECHTSITPDQVFESIKKWL